MEYYYKTKGGVCSQSIKVKIEEGIISEVKFEGGCSGNTRGVGSLVCGMRAQDVIIRLRNIKCGFKASSCPDQLSHAIEEALRQSEKSIKTEESQII